jgi:dihydroorotate dehydrogenase (NAD+) catalytic subunit
MSERTNASANTKAGSQSVQVGELELKNPVLTASGCFGYGLEYEDFFDISKLGGICSKGLSLEPRAGNPPNRICETPGGMLNAIGLANVGVEVFCTEKLPPLRKQGVTVVANIFASTVADFVAIAERLEREEGVAAIELNVSCPNVSKGGIEFGRDAALCAEVTRAVIETTKIPVWVKMSPEAGDICAVAQACEKAGAQAITAINTIRGMSIDPETAGVRLANRTGGLSGTAIRPIALRIVWDLVGAVSIPVIGIGGVSSVRDALEFFMAGATAVQVGTASFLDPCASLRIAEGLEAYCVERGVTIQDVIGSARPSR